MTSIEQQLATAKANAAASEAWEHVANLPEHPDVEIEAAIQHAAEVLGRLLALTYSGEVRAVF